MEIIDLTGDDDGENTNKGSKSLTSTRKRTLEWPEQDANNKKQEVKVFPVYNGWATFDPSTAVLPLSDFIDEYDPSRTPHTVCSWISVHSPTYSPNYDDGARDDRLTNLLSLKHAWMETPNSNRSRDTLDGLAMRFKVVSGKWMIFCSTSDARLTWTAVADAVVCGELGSAAKISTINPTNKQHVICVYTEDFTDYADVMRVRNRLRQLGFVKKMNYKPDAYTHCDIYANNEWKIPATRYNE